MPRWNLVGRILISNQLDAWTKAHRAALMIELADLVLQLDTVAPGSELSLVEAKLASCAAPRLSWRIQLLEDEIVIDLDGDVYVLQETKGRAPLRWRAPFVGRSERASASLGLERRLQGC